ncbi:MAG TPA: succinate dehydrogenase assembly factor 2 [Steroidobacteraceae bacterium]|nr:succinate dehydrogenase assembly factor 2 [Steroidobacteraceae bacterium]
MTGSEAELHRLRWRCRRGMQELDMLLARYLDKRWATAPEEERAAFRALLELPDPELADLCLRGSVTAVSAITRIVAEITHPGGGELSEQRPVYTIGSGRPGRTEHES